MNLSDLIPSAAETYALVAKALADGIQPENIVDLVEWAKDNFIVADGPKGGSKWDPELSPYLVEPLQQLTPDNGVTRVSVRKSAQVGFTGIGIIWMGYIIDVSPAASMVVFPTISSLREFNSEKLQPSIDQTRCLARKVTEQKSRSGKGSTAVKKKFPGGSIALAIASSTADLRSGTKRNILTDEIDEYEDDLNGQGDPIELIDARQTSFHATGDYKKLEGSTPTIKGASKIDAAFEAGDQRYFHVPCPHCDEYQALVFERLKFEKTYPYNAGYDCLHCGTRIEHHQKTGMIRAGKWVATKPGPGRHPSYHIDTLISLLTTWDKIAEKFIHAGNDASKLKAFYNLWLGRSWEVKGDAPEWDKLLARREDYHMGFVPAGGLIISGGSDVQKDGIYYEIVAWGEGKTSWSIDAGFLPGDTADPDSPVWKALTELRRNKRYRDTFGNERGIDIYAIDCKYNSGAVYEWVRKQHNTFAIRGTHRWIDPAIGTPAKQDVDWKGKKKRRGLQIWPVGSYSLKAEFYANLRKEAFSEEDVLYPAGYCHFSAEHDENFFKQLTAEHFEEHRRKRDGRIIRGWITRGPNHFHDCRIYNMGIVEHPTVGLSKMTSNEWAQLRAALERPKAEQQGNLFAQSQAVPAQQKTESHQPPSAPDKDGSDEHSDWFDR